MVVVEPVLTDEKLISLLSERSEQPSLDYKSQCNPEDKGDLIELVKDLGAMSVEGGFIVVGADNRGGLTGEVTDEQVPHFDESRLRAKVRRYIPEPFDLRSACHQLDGKNVVLIYMGPMESGCCVFATDGQVSDGKGGTKAVFRAGDVFVRHGSASERWQQEDISRILKGIEARRKELWLAEVRGSLEQLVHQGSTAQRLAQAPASALTWQMDSETFIATVLEQLRAKDDLPLRILLERVVNDANELMDSEQGLDRIVILLDQLVCLAATLVTLEEREWIRRIVKALVSLYNLGFVHGGDTRQSAVPAERLWLLLAERAVALGGLAVRREEWALVRTLAVQKGEGRRFTDGHYRTWLIHAFIEAEDLLSERTARGVIRHWTLDLARRLTAQHACLRPALGPEDERILDSLCQFDALAFLCILDGEPWGQQRHYFPSFSRFDSRRTEPAFVQVIQDSDVRKAIFRRGEPKLAEALRFIDQCAYQLRGDYGRGWSGFHSPVIKAFLEQYPSPEPQPPR